MTCPFLAAPEYGWGRDLAGRHTSGDGTGGLLMVRSNGITYLPRHDGQGNLWGFSGGYSRSLKAFGQVTFTAQNVPVSVPIGLLAIAHGSKEYFGELGLYNYGRRFYDPKLGRFIGRDPIAEEGGMNLYRFVANNPVNRWDYLGMASTKRDPDFGCFGVQCLGDGQNDDTVNLDTFEVSVSRFKNPEISFGKLPPIFIPIPEFGPFDGFSGGGGSSGNDDTPRKPPYDGLPPCSQIRQQIASGELRPTITVESFIEAQTAWGFRGDGRGFLDSPADGSPGQTFRTSASLTYGEQDAFGEPGESSIAVPIYNLNLLSHTYGEVIPPGTISATGDITVSGNAFVDSAGTYYFNLSASGTNGLLPGIAPPLQQSAYLTVNFNTGVLGGHVDFTIFPAMQVFLNGRSILNYSAEDEGTTPRDLAAPMKRVFLAGYACDPTK